MAGYSQFTAYKSLTIAAFRALLKSPSSVIFTLAFPLVFIMVFGFMGDNAHTALKIAIQPGSDTGNYLYQSIKQDDYLKVIPLSSSEEIQEQLKSGKLIASVSIIEADNNISVKLSESSVHKKEARILELILSQYLGGEAGVKDVPIQYETVHAKKFKSIDFVLPGQLGFSLLAASVFGTAFVFYGLRQTLVLKRFFATPIKKRNILLGEGTARMLFHTIGALIIILMGRYLFDFTLIKGWLTVVNMLIICILGLMMFMSFGFIISGIARNEATVPPLANIITLPQFLLADTFISINEMPSWLQAIARLMPLTYLNDALRSIAFDGAGLWDVRADILILLVWGFLGYAVASRTFKWE